MPRTLERPHALFNLVAGVAGAIRAVGSGLGLLARELSLAEVAMAKSGLFRQRRAQLRALYLASQGETGIGGEARQPAGDRASKGQQGTDLSRLTARRTR